MAVAKWNLDTLHNTNTANFCILNLWLYRTTVLVDGIATVNENAYKPKLFIEPVYIEVSLISIALNSVGTVGLQIYWSYKAALQLDTHAIGPM